MLLQASLAQVVFLDWHSQHLAQLAQGQDLVHRAEALQQLAELFAVPTCSSQLTDDAAGDYQPSLRTERHHSRNRFSASAALLPSLQAAAQPAPKGNARSLPKHLQKPAADPRSDVYLAGCFSHSSVLQTALDLLATEDWNVILISDCCASPASRDHDAALDRLAGQGVELVTLNMLALEWLADGQDRRATAVRTLLAELA